MADFEAFYCDIQGATLDNELAKIVMRYQKEGKPQVVAHPAPAVHNASKIIEEVVEEVKLEQVHLVEDVHNYSHLSLRSASKHKESVVLQDVSNHYVHTPEADNSFKKQVRFDSP